MKKFLKQFDSFESAFYQWLKSLDNKHDPEDLPTTPTNGRFAEWLNNLGYLEDDDLKMDGAEINADLEKIKDIAPKLYNLLRCKSTVKNIQRKCELSCTNQKMERKKRKRGKLKWQNLKI